jgi:hypothetical protein
MKSKNTTKKIGNLSGWAGMVSIQSATLPVTYNVLVGNTTNLPPISMVVMVWLGLILYLIRAIIQKDMLHITSNSIGFFTQSLLMALIVFK